MEKIDDSLFSYSEKREEDSFQVNVEVLTVAEHCISDSETLKLLSSIDEEEARIEKRIAELNSDIDKLTCKADGLDYAVAASAGVICGLIDSFWVGAFDFDNALSQSNQSQSKDTIEEWVETKAEKLKIDRQVNDKIAKAKERGQKLTEKEIKEFREQLKNKLAEARKNLKAQDFENGTKRALGKAIAMLEDRFQLPLDNIYEGVDGISSASHHLDDCAHHPTLLGMIAAILGSLLRCGILVDKDNRIHIRFKKQPIQEWLKVIAPLAISGILIWLLNMAKKKQEDVINSNIPKPLQKLIILLSATPAAISILDVINNWLGHLASDVAGSRTSAYSSKNGMGVPGFFLASLKELSAILPLPSACRASLAASLDDLYEKQHFDLRAELGMIGDIGKALGKQAVPVIAGEIVVRSFYFVRHLVSELQEKGLNSIDWKVVLPFRNRTIARMMTVESSVFTAFDIADSAIRSGCKNGTPYNPLFWKDLIFSINFVGIGRCAIAVGTDIKMGVDRRHMISERMMDMNKSLALHEAKVYLFQSETWKAAGDAQEALAELINTAKQKVANIESSIARMDKKWNGSLNNLSDIINDSPDLGKELLNILHPTR